jgi:MYXO-CTERM domain-containing protein
MNTAKRLRTALLFTTVALGTVVAQTPATDTANPSANANNANTRNDDNDGHNYGWLGLLGLAGLLGLRKRDVHTHQGTGTASGRV